MVSALDPYPWTGATDRDVEIACTQIARRLFRTPFKVVAFLPAEGVPQLMPLLVRIGEALFQFDPRRTGIVAPWRTWDGEGESQRDPKGHGPVVRPLPTPGASELIVPPRASDPDTALLSLQLALRRVEDRFSRVLVDLADWAGPEAPLLATAMNVVDAVAVVGAVGKTTLTGLRETAALVPPEKNLGALLLG